MKIEVTRPEPAPPPPASVTMTMTYDEALTIRRALYVASQVHLGDEMVEEVRRSRDLYRPLADADRLWTLLTKKVPG